MPSADSPLFRVRLRYGKQDAVRFLSHLDLLKTFERALRRAGLPAAYTEGFHARMRLHFGPALALGHASQAEYIDVDLTEDIEPEQVMSALNAACPHGLRMLRAVRVPMHGPALAACLRRASYQVEMPVSVPAERVAWLLSQQEISLQKKNKTVNLRGFVEDLRLVPGTRTTSEGFLLNLDLRLGPEGSIRPEDVIEALLPEAHVKARRIERTALLERRDDAWVEPWPPQTQQPRD
jgi:radical SAM-linked protein